MTYYIILFCLFFFNPSFAAEPLAQGQPGSFHKGERILILAPHPDDETIACAGVIQSAVDAGAKVKIVYLTNGEHNQFAFIVYKKRIVFKQKEFIILGQLRREEAIKAMKLLGVDEKDLVFLGYPDFGTFSIFSRYWNTDKPFRSIMTRIPRVPYNNSPSFGAPYVGESIIADLKKIILDYRPHKIFVSHPADVNVDHKSLYLFLQVVLADLKGKINPPLVYPYLVHHSGWPLPRHYHPKLPLLPPESLSDSQIKWFEFTLSPEQLEKKRQAILCYKSQTESSAFYLLAFARQNELFGDYPVVYLRNKFFSEDKEVSFFGFSKMFSDIGPGYNHEEQDASLGRQGRVSYAISDKKLVIRIEKPKDIVHRFSTVTYIFGYNYKNPFSQMPKIRIITKYNNFKVFNGKKPVFLEGVLLDLKPSELILKIPLQDLGSPDFILSSVRAYIGLEEGGNSPVYTTGFRKINID